MVFKPKIKKIYSPDQVIMVSQMTLIIGKQPTQQFFNDFFWHPSPSDEVSSFVQLSFFDKEIVIVNISDELRSKLSDFADNKGFKLIEFISNGRGEHVSDI